MFFSAPRVRRTFYRVLACGFLISAFAAPFVGSPAGASASSVRAVNTPDALSYVALPGDLGQSEYQAYIPETGHSIRGYMLDYWRANGAFAIYGNPISEPFAASNGYYSQAFENGVFQFIPELVWTDLPSVELMPISRTHLTNQLDSYRPDSRRLGGGGDRRAGSWRPLNPAGKTAQNAIANGEIFNADSGHTVKGDFLAWYQNHEGYSYLGNPISEQVQLHGATVQFFDGAQLVRRENGVVELAPLALAMASELEIDTTPIDGAGLPVYDELLFWAANNPNPLGDPYAVGRKWIEVNISTQTLYAYQGDTLISQTLVSTGIDPNSTEEGLFHVRYKMPTTDMAGLTNEKGEVVELGQDAAKDPDSDEVPYTVEDVPDVMYFNYDAEAFHGAYWHNNFGYKMSHGCVNLPLDFAHFLYGWAPLGTMVWVHE